MMTFAKYFLVILLVLLAGPVLAAMTGLVDVNNDWRTASRDSTGIAPKPADTKEAVVQVYGARTFGWRGAFAVHTWIATKAEGADRYRIYEVVGWNFRHGRSPLVRRHDAQPDRRWYGAAPEIYRDVRGAEAAALLDKIDAAAESYPYRDFYRTWPGPNSNTFIAHIGRSVPELRLDLPPTAIGKDFLGNTTFLAASPSGTGYQVSLFGVLSLIAATEEGLEVSLLGLGVGVDPGDLGLRLPGLGNLSWSES